MLASKPSTLVLAACMSLPAAAVAQEGIFVSIGLRETGMDVPVGANGGDAGGIEWVNRDGQLLFVDGTWQQFTWNLAFDPILGFAGATANHFLEGTDGTLEHIRFAPLDGTGPYEVWIDDITVTTATDGQVELTGFEGYDHGQEVMFQEPSHSGSTAAFLTEPLLFHVAGVDINVAHSGEASYYARWEWNSTVGTWMRFNTFNTPILPNPAIPFDDGAVVSMWMRAEIYEPPAPTCLCELTDDSPAAVDVFDLLAYLDVWFASDEAADLDGTPGVDVFDLLMFLDCWFGGCP